MDHIPIVMLVTGGRNGSLFFQSLLDGHPEILQFPGPFLQFSGNSNLDNFIQQLCLPILPDNLAYQFAIFFPAFFSSSRNPLNRMDQLGDDKNSSFQVSFELFKENLDFFLKESNNDKALVIQALHLAYAKACEDQALSSKKIIVMHIHHAKYLPLLARFLKFTTLFLDRDPLPSLQSELDGWIRFLGPRVNFCQYAIGVSRKILEPLRVMAINQPAYTIRIEDIHTDHKNFMEHFCAHFGITPHPCLVESTFMGLKWWGDRISEKLINGLNPHFSNKIEIKKFYFWELRWIERAIFNRLKAYSYPTRSRKFYKNAFWLFLPSKYETKIGWILIKEIFNGTLSSKRQAIRNLLGYFRVFNLKIEILRYSKNSDLPPLLWSKST